MEQGELLETRFPTVQPRLMRTKKPARPIRTAAMPWWRLSIRCDGRPLGRADCAARRKTGLAAAQSDAPGELKARREAAQIQAEHGTDRKASIRRWEDVHKLAPEDIDVLRALERLYANEGSVSEAYLKVLSDWRSLCQATKND